MIQCPIFDCRHHPRLVCGQPADGVKGSLPASAISPVVRLVAGLVVVVVEVVSSDLDGAAVKRAVVVGCEVSDAVRIALDSWSCVADAVCRVGPILC